MPILIRYLLSQLGLALLVVWLGLVGLVVLFDFLASVNDMRGDYDTPAVLKYVLMLVPRRFYDLLPVASLLATLVVLGNMANQSELIIMQVSGKSKIRLVTYLALPLVLLSFLSVIVFDSVILDLQKHAIAEREDKIGRPGREFIKPYWYKSKNTIIHFKYPVSPGLSKRVSIYELDEENFIFKRYIHAASIAYQEQTQEWLLQDAKDYQFTQDPNNPDVLDYDKLIYKHSKTLPIALDITPESLQLAAVLPEFMRFHDLQRYMAYLKQQTRPDYAYGVVYWSRLFVPFATLALIYLGAAFIFGPLRSASTGQRVMTGFFIGLIFNSVQSVAGAVSIVFAINPLILVILPNLLVLFIAFILQRR